MMNHDQPGPHPDQLGVSQVETEVKQLTSEEIVAGVFTILINLMTTQADNRNLESGNFQYYQQTECERILRLLTNPDQYGYLMQIPKQMQQQYQEKGAQAEKIIFTSDLISKFSAEVPNFGVLKRSPNEMQDIILTEYKHLFHPYNEIAVATSTPEVEAIKVRLLAKFDIYKKAISEVLGAPDIADTLWNASQEKIAAELQSRADIEAQAKKKTGVISTFSGAIRGLWKGN